MRLVDLALRRPLRTPHADAAATLDDGVTVYWRDGCPFCLRLRWRLRRYADRVTWVDIWADPDAAAFVRTTNPGGHEIVPTVVIDGTAYTISDPGVVLTRTTR